jgi:transcriptional regulator with XRE-family HTH domain
MLGSVTGLPAQKRHVPIGRNIRAALELAGKTRGEAAQELGISDKSLVRTVRGERTPRNGESARLAEFLGVPESFLLEGLGPEQVISLSRPAMRQRLDQVDGLIRQLEAERAWLRESLTAAPR